MAVLTPDEVENLRFHLSFGNLNVGAYPWTPDGFFELFTNVIAVYLSDATTTTATTAIDASAGPVIVAVTPASMAVTLTDGSSGTIHAGQRLIVDTDDDAEIVVVKSTTVTTFSAKFQNSHDVSGYQVAIECGTSRLRYLLHRADRVHQAMLSPLVTAVSGLQSVDKQETVWFGPTAVLKSIYAQYEAVVMEISRLVRVGPAMGSQSGPVTRMETY